MTSTLFDELCATLGYEPSSVLSIRINNREIAVTHTDDAGASRTTVRMVADGSGRPAAREIHSDAAWAATARRPGRPN